MRISPTSLWFTVVLGICAALPALSIDLSAPTLTLLPGALSTTTTIAGLSLSLFMAGFAIGQFSGGRASDWFGRRPVLLISLTVYILGGLCCAVATTGPGLAAARSAQGIGAGACAVQASAIVQDLFRGEAARQKQAYISVVLAIMPMLAPALGTLLIAQAGWRSVHLILAVGGLVLAIMIVLFVAESRPASRRLRMRGIGLSDAVAMLGDVTYRRIVVANALSYGTVFCYIAGAPVVVMTELNQPPYVYAALFAATALALSAGAITNAALGRRGLGGDRLIWPGLLLQAASTLAMVLIGSQLQQAPLAAAVPLLVSCFARGVLSPNLIHLAVSRHREQAGLASAVVGLLQLLVGALASAVVAALLARWGYWAMAVPMALLSCGAATVWRLLRQPAGAAEASRID